MAESLPNPMSRRLVVEAIGSALVATPASAQPLLVDIRGAKLHLQLVKPPFVPLKKSS